MKVLHIISGGDKGGAKTHMFALLDELCKIADVTVVCLFRGVFYEEILKRNVRTILFEQKLRIDFTVCSKIASLISNEGFDIVNAHGPRANFIASLLRRKINIPIVTTIHSDYKLDFDTVYKKLLFESLNVVALRKIKYKIAVSDSFKDMLIDRGFNPNDIFTVYNGMNFDDEINPIPRFEFAKKYNIPFDENNIYIGIAARFNRVKGVDIFLRAAAEVYATCPNARFIIIGEGDEKENLITLTENLGITDKVYFLGFVREVYDFLNFIDINMLTSLSESFPYSLLEGAKAKKATVASAVGGIPHLIRDGETGLLFKSRDYEECAEKLIYLIKNREKITEFGQKLYEKASTEFSNRALANAYLENYRKIIAKFNRTKKYDIILSGYYGFDNFGDDLVLATLVHSFVKARPDISILILSNKPKRTKKQLRVDAKSRYNIFAIMSALNKSKVYVYGGGSLLTDVTSTRSLLYYTTIINMAKRKGLKVMLLSNGIGPFIKEKNKKRALNVLDSIDLITLRDQGSMQLLRDCNKDKNALLTADAAFLYTHEVLNSSQQTMYNFSKLYGINGKYFVISLREWKNNVPDFEDIIARCCDYAFEKYSLIPVFIPLQPEKDLMISYKTASKMKHSPVVINEGTDSVHFITELIARSEFSLGMRLHNLIYAIACGVPVIGLSYDDKVQNFISENNVGKAFSTQNLNESQLIDEIDRIMNQSENVKGYLNVCVDNLRDAAFANITAALQLLNDSKFNMTSDKE